MHFEMSHLEKAAPKSAISFSPTDTPPPDNTVFRQMFQTLNDDKKTHVSHKGAAMDAGTVGNPTGICQQDGGGSDMDMSEEDLPASGVSDELDSGDPDTNDEKENNNNALMTLMSAFNPQADRRIFTNFESAGLPRKEIARLAHQLHESVIAGRQTVSLGLRVPELGELRFDVRIAGKIVLIHAFVETEQAAAALALAVSTLREKLEEHALVLGRLDVTTDDRGRRQNADKDDRSDASTRNPKAEEALPLPSLGILDRDKDSGRQPV